MSSKVLLAYATFPDAASAEQICDQLVSEGIIACANIMAPMKSIYRWKNQLVKENETGAILKLSALKQAALKERFRALHPYQTPALLFLEPSDGTRDFLQWIALQSF